MKVVINKCYGGFGLSEEACRELGVDDVYKLSRIIPGLVGSREVG